MPATLLTPQQLIEAAKAPIVAYSRKDWNAVKAGLASDVVYDELATQRRVEGADATIALWQGWAAALPDSAATIHAACASGNTVVLELIWTGTHTGPLTTPNGVIAATGKRIEVRACQVIELAPETGKTTTQRHYFDLGTLLAQLGV
jgi:steroid delta-isomerase-like uncharacterized protein